MKYQNRTFLNIGILTLVFVFLALGYVGEMSSAQTKKNAKSTPTPKSKSKSTPTPKKAKATPTPGKTKNNQKTTAKTKPTPTPKKDAKSKNTSSNDKNSKTKTASNNKNSQNNKNSNNKQNSKTALTSKTSKTNDKKTNDKKTNDKKTTTNSIKKPQTASTKTTSKSSKPDTQNSRTQTPVKQTKPTTTTVQPDKDLPRVVVSALSTSIHSAPNLTSSEISRAKLGSIYSVVDRNTGWYKVQISTRGTNSTGWIPSTSTTNLETSGNEEIYQQILNRNYKNGKLTFAEAAEVYDFLTRVQPEIKNQNAAADFGLKRLMALRAALEAIPVEQKDQKTYQDFIKAQDPNIVYSEPAGEWYVRAPVFWDLHSKYTSLPAGEKIAWAAAKNPLPGECEGYVNCYLFLLRMTDGEYLNFYPTGEHSVEALTNIIRLLTPIAADSTAKTIYNGPSDVSDRAEFNSLITELRVIISRSPSSDKDKALQQLKKIAEGYR